MIQVLYANPSARVCIGGVISDLFPINRGTRQGWPLSPLIFNLSIEPLAQYILNCAQITPIQIGSSVHAVSVYADDTLLYMSDVQSSLPYAIKVLQNFGVFSGFKINLSKSGLMLVNGEQSQLILPPSVSKIFRGFNLNFCSSYC